MIPFIVGMLLQMTMEDKIRFYAQKWQVPYVVMDNVVRCESGYDPKVPGDGGTSIGLAQIHLPDHHDITKWQAEDPDFALDWMGKQMHAGRYKMWSCYKTLFPDGY